MEHFTQENIVRHIHKECQSTPYEPVINFRDCEPHPSKHQTITVYFRRDGISQGGCEFKTRELLNNPPWKRAMSIGMQHTFRLIAGEGK